MSRLRKGRSVAVKLNMLIVVTTSLAILLVTLAAVHFDYRDSQKEVRDLLVSHAELFGINNTTAIDLDNPVEARAYLKSFEALKAMTMAVIYNSESKAFASYHKDSANVMLIPPAKKPGYYQEEGFLNLYQPIKLDNDMAGTILLRYDMPSFYQRLPATIISHLLLGLLAITFSILLVTWFQRALIRPIQLLAETAEKVTQEGDYSVRLEVDSRNEIGQLSDVFNEMLQQVQDRDGELVRSRDVLERRVIERTKELTVAKEQAEQAARSKSQFLAAMSHEIRTPLNGVMGMSSVLSATELNDEQRDSLGMVQSSAESLLTTLNGILDFSKIEAGNIELEPSSFNVRDSFEELLDVMRIKALEKSVYLQLYIDRQVPTWIVGDIGRIRQVMMNFISNAIKFTSHGGVLVEVSSKLSEDGLYDLTFTVHDEGIGIAKNKLYDVFEQFTQLDGSTTRQYGGMGLGLSISYLLGQLMGGELSVASKLNKGSSFSLSLSLPEADREQDEAEINSNLLAGATLLIVGDVTAEHQVSAKWCRSWCDQVIATQSTDGGYTEMAKLAGGCDILILDECIGHREALLMASEFRAKYPELIIIMLVAKQIDALASIQSAGVSGYLARPVKEWQLKQGLIDLLVARDKRSNGFDVLKPFITPDSNQNKADAKTVQEQRKLRILLAEDNVVNQKVAVHMLQKLGCIVDVAANGREVIRMRKQFPYDLIFMDCHMPVLDGYDATRAIREEEQDQGNHIYIYALTANTMSDEVDLCRKVGMDGFVGKPVKINDLQYIIDNLGSDLIDNLVWPLAYN